MIDPESDAMTDVAASDADVAEFVRHTEDFWGTWTEAYDAAHRQESFRRIGGSPIGCIR